MCSVFEEFPKGWGVKKIPQKWKILGGGGVLCEIPSVVGIWIFSGTTHLEKVAMVGTGNLPGQTGLSTDHLLKR